MTLPIELAPEALSDVAEAFAHYDRVQPELANDFVARIDAALLLVAELPLARQILYRDVRRLVLRRFPHAIFYRAEAARVVVLGVRHQASDPEQWPGSAER